MITLCCILAVLVVGLAAFCWRLMVVFNEEQERRIEAELELAFGRKDDDEPVESRGA